MLCKYCRHGRTGCDRLLALPSLRGVSLYLCALLVLSSLSLGAFHIPAGTEDFYELAMNSSVFIDKSLLIEEFVKSEHRVMVITRPKGWGKTLNLNMLKRFLNIEVSRDGVQLPKNECVNYKLFAGGAIETDGKRTKYLKPLKISRYGNYMGLQGEFPVISVSFKDVDENTYQRTTKKIKEVIRSLYREHEYLQAAISPYNLKTFKGYCNGHFSDRQLEDSLLFLSRVLCSHFQQKVYILIDDYDAPVVNLLYQLAARIKSKWRTLPEETVLERMLENLDFDHTFSLLQSIYLRCFENNKSLKKALLTGTIPIDLGESLNLGVNEKLVKEYSLSERGFSEFYGFSQEEVDQLLVGLPYKLNRTTVCDWYGGYNYAGKMKYNAGSLMKCLANKGRFFDYNRKSSNTGFVDYACSSYRMQAKIQHLSVPGQKINDTIAGRLPFNVTEYGLSTFLFHGGFLNPHHIFNERRVCMPNNREIESVYKIKIMKWACQELRIKSQTFAEMAAQLTSLDVVEFANSLQRHLSAIPSNNYTLCGDGMKLFYTAIVRSLLYFLETDYLLQRYRQHDNGRIELVLVPKLNRSRDAILLRAATTKDMKYLRERSKTTFAKLNETETVQSLIDFKRFHYVKRVLLLSLVFYVRYVECRYDVQNVTVAAASDGTSLANV